MRPFLVQLPYELLLGLVRLWQVDVLVLLWRVLLRCFLIFSFLRLVVFDSLVFAVLSAISFPPAQRALPRPPSADGLIL